MSSQHAGPKMENKNIAPHAGRAVRRISGADQPSLIPSFSKPLAIFQPSPSAAQRSAVRCSGGVVWCAGSRRNKAHAVVMSPVNCPVDPGFSFSLSTFNMAIFQCSTLRWAHWLSSNGARTPLAVFSPTFCLLLTLYSDYTQAPAAVGQNSKYSDSKHCGPSRVQSISLSALACL